VPPIRQAIARRVRLLMAAQNPDAPPPEDPPGDAGWYGPQSAIWRVHGDFTSMMIGGIAALLLQMLHPGALAGVWDHSDFRRDRQGRLGRTALFIARTTYAPTAEAEAAVARVRSIHGRVRGVLADGTAYSADDPTLLAWVHACESWCFLKSYLRYRDPGFSAAEQDRYLAEAAQVAYRLGATEVPETRADLEAYFRAVRPALRYDARTREVTGLLLDAPAVSPGVAPFAELFFDAAKDLLPPWAAQMHGFHVPVARRPAVRLGVNGVGRVLRWSLQNSAEARARRRVAAFEAQTAGPSSGQPAPHSLEPS
jgi:uncharacterized protein (DUF2236 family)